MRLLASISWVACLCAGCTNVVGTSDFYVVSGGGGSGAGSEGGGGAGGGSQCEASEFLLTVTCSASKPCLLTNESSFAGTKSFCVTAGAVLEADCSNGKDTSFDGCEGMDGDEYDFCTIPGPNATTVTVSCVDDG